jgi:hypothetical protein
VPRLTIVVSAGGSTESLESTLVSVLEHRPHDCEILVALTKPYSDPYQLQGEVRFVQAAPNADVVTAIRQAIHAARAPFVHLLASGCTVNEGWVEPALARFGDRKLASVVPLVLDARQPERLLAAGLGYRSSGKRVLLSRGQVASDVQRPAGLLGPCLFAAFYRKAALALVDGPSAALGAAQADVDLALALAHAGFATALEPASSIVANADVDGQETPFRRALHEERLFWRSLSLSNAGSSLAAHAGLLALESLRSVPRPRLLAQWAGRLLACCQLGSYARRRAMLAQLNEREGIRVDGAHPAAPSQQAKSRAAVH